jgi:hypothetical protein
MYNSNGESYDHITATVNHKDLHVYIHTYIFIKIYVQLHINTCI